MPKIVLKPSPNFDLLPKNPRPGLLKLDDTKVNVEITLEVKAATSAKTDRLTKVAEEVMAQYRKAIVDTAEAVTAKWDKMTLAERNKDVPELIKSVNNAVKALQSAIEKAVKAQIEREYKGDKNLLEARVAVVVRCTFKVIAIGKDVAELAVTAGASVKAWKDLVSDLYKLAKLVHDASKDEPALRTDLLKAIGEYCTTKQRRLIEAQKATDWKAKAKLKLKELWTSQKSLAEKCEAQRKKYRNEVTALIQNVEKMGKKRDELLATIKKSGKLNPEGVKAGAKVMELGRAVKELNDLILKHQVFVDDMAMLLTEAGIQVDDRTAVQKLRSLQGLKSVKDAAKELHTAIEDIKSIIEAMS